MKLADVALWPFATDMASHLFGSDRRHSGRGQRTLETSKMTRICHRVADFAVTHNATSDVVR